MDNIHYIFINFLYLPYCKTSQKQYKAGKGDCGWKNLIWWYTLIKDFIHILKNNIVAITKTNEAEKSLLANVHCWCKVLFFPYSFKNFKLSLIFTYFWLLLDNNVAFDDAG